MSRTARAAARDLLGARAGAVPGIGVGRQALAHRPPSSSWTGRSSALPTMSHSAISIAPIALFRIGPPRANSLRNIACHRRSIANADWPIDVALGQLLDRRLDRLRLPFAGALADARDAVVGEDLGEHPVAPARADQVGLDPRDPAVAAARGHDRLPTLRRGPPVPFQWRNPTPRSSSPRRPGATRATGARSASPGAAHPWSRRERRRWRRSAWAWSAAGSWPGPIRWRSAPCTGSPGRPRPRSGGVRLADVSRRLGESTAQAWGWEELQRRLAGGDPRRRRRPGVRAHPQRQPRRDQHRRARPRQARAVREAAVQHARGRARDVPGRGTRAGACTRSASSIANGRRPPSPGR